jgi:hypothetical protein
MSRSFSIQMLHADEVRDRTMAVRHKWCDIANGEWIDRPANGRRFATSDEKVKVRTTAQPTSGGGGAAALVARYVSGRPGRAAWARDKTSHLAIARSSARALVFVRIYWTDTVLSHSLIAIKE